MADPEFLKFKEGFLWGAATSAYQIEGAWNLDGKGPSIWDRFVRLPGKVRGGETGDLAVDHYHRWREDVRIMAGLGLKVYRFSIAWTRIFPTGRGAVNPAGLDFYDRMVDALLENGIQPIPTLFHYDLPQALHEQGGWPARATADYFGDYARVVGQRLGDRVSYWITHNEPFVTAVLGYFLGDHAPGLQDPAAAFHATHTLLLSHGKAVQALRSVVRQPAQIGIALNLSPVHAASQDASDRQAAARFDAFLNRAYLEPILLGRYPQEIFELGGAFFPEVAAGDMATISAPIDFLGVNYYNRSVMKFDASVPILQAAQVYPQGNDYSQMWEIYPPGIYELVARVWQDYHPKSIFVTENGVPVPDGLDFDGRVRDVRRIQFLQDHLVQVHRALQEGIPIQGYLVWSLMDNFEWALGYQMRFGLVYVDFQDLSRTVKDSGRWFSRVIRENGFLA